MTFCNITSALIVPPSYEFRIAGKCFGCGEIGRGEFRPKSGHGITESGYSALGRDTSASERDDAVCRAEEFMEFFSIWGHHELDPLNPGTLNL
jgi:hypothetical protein